MRYDHAVVEKKWQEYWGENDTYAFDPARPGPKYYALEMFPYPSGDLHIGHWSAYTGPDIHARYKKMTGSNVFHPMGFDAFGLPAENAAIKRGYHPDDWTQENIASMMAQFKRTGMSYDWSLAVNTSQADYYKWTQWLFLKFYERGLAYRSKAKVNWCEHDQTVLANEQVEDGLCWRCGNEVVQKDLEQWFFKITDYAEELLSGLEGLDWPEQTKAMQRNWIGRSEGVEFDFVIEGQSDVAVRVYTTKPETIYGATYLVVAPDHPLLNELITPDNRRDVEEYVTRVLKESERQRMASEEKTGIFTGSYAKHPLTGELLPVWTGNYVLSTYATGAIMGVPAHDERDWEFAEEYQLPKTFILAGAQDGPTYDETAELINSYQFDGMTASRAREEIGSLLASDHGGELKVTYRLRDWLVSRQRYWGAPIPMVQCETCGLVPVPEDQLPVLLPREVDFKPTGKPPLATSEDFISVDCPTCGQKAERMAETMDTFVDSSWYFLRYVDSNNATAAFDVDKAKALMPVDVYVGGAEHTVLHLLYSRFFTKALRDMGLLTVDEPFTSLRHQGMILGPDHQKMSKSKGNVVNPDELVEDFGADAVRLQLAFMGPFDQGGPWQLTGIHGPERFLQRAWAYQQQRDGDWPAKSDGEVEALMGQVIERVSEDIGEFKFNTAVSQLMTLLNAIYKSKAGVSKQLWVDFVKMLAPFAPHLSEELWQSLGMTDSVHLSEWPVATAYHVENEGGKKVALAIQVNGKTRGVLDVSESAGQDEVVAAAEELDGVKRNLAGKEVVRVIYVPGKILNLVAK